ncbi:unnamed protein product [Zymoseptoria tritici ST99CH_3D7]|uniref:Glucose N-acetyltransferase 1 n=2 Tax=Zymoseptoria tritici TaxID=1047171 RepID=A0A1X7S2S3_ZYMT9|nr:unnamed protein product [Zymoseptoria tritici ST99CH_3D7]
MIKRWSKVHERFALAVALLLLMLWFALSRSSLLYRRNIHFPRHPWSIRTKHHSNTPPPPGKTWNEFAYATYATDSDYLCNSLMLLETLHRLGSQPERLLLYPRTWDSLPTDSIESRLLVQARDLYSAVLQPIDLQEVSSISAASTWMHSPTKLLAFNQTQFSRILALDSDSTLLQPLDELFHLAEAPVAMPRAYWKPLTSDGRQIELTSAVTLLTPSSEAFASIQAALLTRGKEDFDMEILNKLYGDSALVLPHRGNILLTGEFRESNHSGYLADAGEVWDAKKILREAKYVHFSDWPLPKPWQPMSKPAWEQYRPSCGGGVAEAELGCAEREIWEGLHRDFRERRGRVCGSELMNSEWIEVEIERQRVYAKANKVLADVDAQREDGIIQAGSASFK